MLAVLMLAINVNFVKASTTFEPDPSDPHGGTEWDFDEGDILAYKMTYIEAGKTMAPCIFYYNVSNFDKYSHYYHVQLALMFFNATTNTLEPLPSRPLINASRINFGTGRMDPGDVLPEYITTFKEDFNLFIPKNTSGLKRNGVLMH